jgi:soluble lytic murein transglycosylase-like protein
MLPRFGAFGFAVALLVGFAGTAIPAGATEAPAAEHYATVLRTINPHLQKHQSLAYARSLLVDADRSNLDPNLIMALVTVESSWQQTAVSHSGARGLGQLMPTTAHNLGVNARDPAQNLRGAATYLRSLIDRFAGRGVNTMRYAIGAYNSGPRAVEKFHGIPPYHETQRYVTKVLAQWHTLSARVAKVIAAGAHVASPMADERQWLAHTEASALPATAPAPQTAAPQTAPVTPAEPAAEPASSLEP